jgi:hypothetical protein
LSMLTDNRVSRGGSVLLTFYSSLSLHYLRKSVPLLDSASDMLPDQR